MEWTRYIDGYCERTDPSYWSEPVNAITNAAFLIAAFVMWRRTQGRGLTYAPGLIAVLVMIGVGSYLFHTYAQVWASMADTAPILFFILLYVFVATHRFLEMPIWIALGVTVLFIPYGAVVGGLFAMMPFFEISSFYWPIPILILAYAALLAFRKPVTARGLAIGAVVLIVSLMFRSLDESVCDSLPVGTHFMWHILNGIMLGWMIEVYRRHEVGADQGGLAARRAGV